MYSKKWLPLHVAATWVCGFVFLVPPSLSLWGQFGLDLTIGSCTIILDKNGRSSKEFLFVFAFLSPCLAIIVCYARWVKPWLNSVNILTPELKTILFKLPFKIWKGQYPQYFETVNRDKKIFTHYLFQHFNEFEWKRWLTAINYSSGSSLLLIKRHKSPVRRKKWSNPKTKQSYYR